MYRTNPYHFWNKSVVIIILPTREKNVLVLERRVVVNPVIIVIQEKGRTMESQSQSQSQSLSQSQGQNPSNKTAILDAPIHAMGFQLEEISPTKVSGRLPVTSKACQVLPPLLLPPSPSSSSYYYYQSVCPSFFLLWFFWEKQMGSHLRCYTEGYRRWSQRRWPA